MSIPVRAPRFEQQVVEATPSSPITPRPSPISSGFERFLHPQAFFEDVRRRGFIQALFRPSSSRENSGSDSTLVSSVPSGSSWGGFLLSSGILAGIPIALGMASSGRGGENDDPHARVELLNGSREIRVNVDLIMRVLQDLYQNEPENFRDVVRTCRSVMSAARLDTGPVFFGNTEEILRQTGWLEIGGIHHAFVNVVLSATEGEGREIRLVSPLPPAGGPVAAAFTESREEVIESLAPEDLNRGPDGEGWVTPASHPFTASASGLTMGFTSLITLPLRTLMEIAELYPDIDQRNLEQIASFYARILQDCDRLIEGFRDLPDAERINFVQGSLVTWHDLLETARVDYRFRTQEAELRSLYGNLGPLPLAFLVDQATEYASRHPNTLATGIVDPTPREGFEDPNRGPEGEGGPHGL